MEKLKDHRYREHRGGGSGGFSYLHLSQDCPWLMGLLSPEALKMAHSAASGESINSPRIPDFS